MPEQRLRFLADASMLLASSLDIRQTLNQLAAALVPGSPTVMRRIAGKHGDALRESTMQAYLDGFAAAMTEPLFASRRQKLTVAVPPGRLRDARRPRRR